jgi:hypothetical protein
MPASRVLRSALRFLITQAGPIVTFGVSQGSNCENYLKNAIESFRKTCVLKISNFNCIRTSIPGQFREVCTILMRRVYIFI